MSRRQTKMEQARARQAAFLARRRSESVAQSRMLVDALIERGWDIYVDRSRGVSERASRLARAFILCCLAALFLGMLADLRGCL